MKVRHSGPATDLSVIIPTYNAKARAHKTVRTLHERLAGTGLSVEQQEKIQKLIAETGADLARLLDYFNVQSLGDIRANQFDRVIRSLEHRRAA